MFNLTYSEISVRENSSQKGPCFFFFFFLKVVLLYKIWIWKSHEVQIGKTCHDTISFRAFWYRLWITTLGQSESLVLFQFWFVEMRWQDACECRCRFQGKSWILLHRNKSFFFYFQNINTNSYWFVVNVITVTIEELEEKWSLFKENDICPSFREASVT